MVYEGFGFPRALRNAEDVSEELFDDEKVRLGRKRGVKGKDWSGAFQAVAWEMEF